MDIKKISVIMPIYNAEQYVEKTIMSILNQTYSNFELIIIDDHPTDNTLKIVERIKDDRIKILHNDRNRGIAYSRNVGLKSAIGEFIAIMDHDDLAPEYRFEKQVNYLNEHIDIDILGGSIQLIDENDKPLAPPTGVYTNPKYIEALFLFYNVFCNSEVMFRRKLLTENDILYQDNCLGMEDFRFWIDCSKIGKMTFLEELLLYHRMTPQNETMRVMNDLKNERIKLFSEMQNYSLRRSGFKLKGKYLAILNKVMTEDQQGVCQSGEEMRMLYEAFKELVFQAEKMQLHNYREIADMCRFYFTSRTRLMSNSDLWK